MYSKTRVPCRPYARRIKSVYYSMN
jgi:hypothetical protein